MSDELKPCPFCGGDAKHYHRDDNSGWENTDWVGCTDICGASTACYETKDLAVAVWNTRIAHDNMTDRIEELEAENKNLKSMIASVIDDTGDDPEIMAASRAEWAARAFGAEAKLAKAMETLGKLADCVDDGCFCSEMEMATAMDTARTTLAELKGETDE